MYVLFRIRQTNKFRRLASKDTILEHDWSSQGDEFFFFDTEGCSDIDVKVPRTDILRSWVCVNSCTNQVQNCRQIIAVTQRKFLNGHPQDETSASPGHLVARIVKLTAQGNLEQAPQDSSMMDRYHVKLHGTCQQQEPASSERIGTASDPCEPHQGNTEGTTRSLLERMKDKKNDKSDVISRQLIENVIVRNLFSSELCKVTQPTIMDISTFTRRKIEGGYTSSLYHIGVFKTRSVKKIRRTCGRRCWTE